MTRKRRRVLIGFAAVVVLIGFGYWLTRPRVDPRFFGEWHVYSAASEARTIGEVEPGALVVLALNPDGTGRYSAAQLDKPLTVQWWVGRDSRFYWQGDIPLVDKLWNELGRFRNIFSGQDAGEYDGWTIKSITPSRIVMENKNYSPRFQIIEHIVR